MPSKEEEKRKVETRVKGPLYENHHFSALKKK